MAATFQAAYPKRIQHHRVGEAGNPVINSPGGLIGICQQLPSYRLVRRGQTVDRWWLRDGLMFTDGVPVRAQDCIPSILRSARRTPVVESLMARTKEMSAVDDRTLQFRLKKPFALLPFALTAVFIMPERIAKTDAFTMISEHVGSGPYKFVRNAWKAGSSALYLRNDKYVSRNEPISTWAGGKVTHFDRIERRAVVAALVQQDFVYAVGGDQKALPKTGGGNFPPASPYASTAGLEAITGPRNLDAARKMVAESGYKGEPIVLMLPSDQPAIQASAQVAHALFKSLGLSFAPPAFRAEFTGFARSPYPVFWGAGKA